MGSSPLRLADPRAKLALAMCASLAAMLPLERLVVATALYAGLLLWAGLLPEVGRQVRRLRWVLLLLFLVDWLVVDLGLAVTVTIRLLLLAGSFALVFATTTPAELGLALEWLRIPYRYAFSVRLAFHSVSLLEDEWWNIREAQAARGAWARPAGRAKLSLKSLATRRSLQRLGDLVALTVPAVVLTTRRAWAMTEAAYSRGFDSPHRQPYRRLAMNRLDWLLLAVAAAAGAALLLWR